MKIEYKSQIKTHQSNLYTNLNHEMVKENKKQESKQTKKEDKEIRNNIHTNMRLKINMLNIEQREIQEKISIIQCEEVKANEIENTLIQVRNIYAQSIQNSKQDKIQENIKVIQLSNKVNILKQGYGKEDEDLKNITSKGELINEESKIIHLIDNTLSKINKIKRDLSKNKTKLIYLEQEVRNSEGKVKNNEKYITEQIVINPIDFIFIQGNTQTGIIINIYC